MASTRFVEIFCAVAESTSFSEAAKQLGITPAAVSRAIARQEAATKVRLVQRSTRSMALTAAGTEYYRSCREALSILAEAERGLAKRHHKAKGPVRLSASTTYTHYRLMPAIREFVERHPEVELELNITSENADLVVDRTQLAVRRGTLEDSTQVAIKLEDASVGLFASPGYVARRGAPTAAEQLEQHICIPFTLPRTGRIIPWAFFDTQGGLVRWSPPPRVHCSGDFLGCVELAKQGLGIVQAYHFLVEQELRQGTLTELLTPHTSGLSVPFSLVRAGARHESLAARLLAETILAHCRQRATD